LSRSEQADIYDGGRPRSALSRATAITTITLPVTATVAARDMR
jgi:hypothetical protein